MFFNPIDLQKDNQNAGKKEAISKVIVPVILNLFQDLNAPLSRSRNKFGMTLR
jgi:hypothetical protein